MMLDLRTERPEMGLDIGKIYQSLSTEYWNVMTEISGYNGAGGYWVKQHWNWKNGKTHHTDILSLSHEQSRELESKISALSESKVEEKK